MIHVIIDPDTGESTTFDTRDPNQKMGLVEWRKLQGVRQSDLAEAIGMSAYNLSRIENGKSDVKLKDAYKISEVLRVKVEQLFPKGQVLPPSSENGSTKTNKLTEGSDPKQTT